MGSPVVVSTPVDGKVNAGMLAWGYGLVLSSTLCFVLGVWSIAVGPFVDTEGLLVSARCRFVCSMVDMSHTVQ